MKRVFIILLAIFLSGCSLFNVKTTVTTPDNKEYVIDSKSNSMVTFNDGEAVFTVDNRGREGLIQTMIQAPFAAVVKSPPGSIEVDSD